MSAEPIGGRSASRGRRVAVLAASIMLGTGASPVGVAPAAGEPAARTAQSSPELAIRALRREIDYRSGTRIVGRLVGAPGEVADRTIQLYADDFPHGDGVLVNGTQTRSDGTYTFIVQPARNTIYRTVAPQVPTSSLTTTIFVYPRSSFGLRVERSGDRLTALLQGAAPITPRVPLAYFYFLTHPRRVGSRVLRRNERLARRVAVRRWLGPFGGTIRAVALVPAPATTGRYEVCVKVSPPFVGMGRSLPVDSTCGLRSVIVIR